MKNNMFQVSASAIRFSIIVVAGAGLLLTGCASTSPNNAKFSQELSKEKYLDANDAATVKVKSNDGVIITTDEKERMALVITNKVNEQKILNVDSEDKREFEMEVLITRYEKGNAFARAMLAGLGQIHIDAKVSLFLMPEREQIANFNIDKTFAWGGIYGGFTSIEDVEEGFATGVAEAVTKIEK